MFKLLDGPFALAKLPLPVFLTVAPVLAVAVLVPLGWHVLWCIETAAHGWQSLALLVAGLAIPPLGWVHGMSLLPGSGGWL